MSTNTRRYSVLLLLILVVAHTGTPLLAQTVEISDPELERAVRLALDLSTGDITVAAMESLTALDAGTIIRDFGPPIRSFEGIQSAVNLTNLSLVGGYAFGVHRASVDVEDFAPLASLPKLYRLDLYRNLLTTISLPDGMNSLRELDLEANQLSDITLPRGLTNLTWLDLEVNLLTDLILPDDLTNLTTLGLSGNQFTEFSVTGNLSRLERLGLMGNYITNLVLGDDLAGLSLLFVQLNPLQSVTLPYWIDLDGLDLRDFPKEEVSFHAGTIKIQNGELSWPGGILEYKADLPDDWIPLPASSPIQLAPIGDRGFFRVRIEP